MFLTVAVLPGRCFPLLTTLPTANMSKITYANRIVAITETNEPKLDTKFQPAYESGKSGILLGIPANPKKC